MTNPACPYCGSEALPEQQLRACDVCGAAHHADCWSENRGCSVFGCQGGPADEPVLSIGSAELSRPTPGILSPLPAPESWPQPALPVFARQPKNRAVYVVLGVFLGIFGAHNFYAGYIGRAITQLCLTVCTLFIGSFVTFMWALVEVCMIDRDNHDIPMS